MNNIFPKNLSASLARRLAEAADGFRNSGNVFFIARYKFPHALKNFKDLDSAKAYFSMKSLANNEYGIFGPFQSNDELQKSNFLPVEEIEKVDLTINYKDGRTQTVVFKQCVDAIFLNLSSFDKFVFPYYCRVYSTEYAEKLRKKLIAQYKEYGKNVKTGKYRSKLPPVGKPHSCGTLTCDLNDAEDAKLL